MKSAIKHALLSAFSVKPACFIHFNCLCICDKFQEIECELGDTSEMNASNSCV